MTVGLHLDLAPGDPVARNLRENRFHLSRILTVNTPEHCLVHGGVRLYQC